MVEISRLPNVLFNDMPYYNLDKFLLIGVYIGAVIIFIQNILQTVNLFYILRVLT